jgi:hypothetical protein
MLRLILTAAAIAFLATPASSQTLSGRVEPGFLQRHAFTPAASGQFLATASWDASAARLLLILVCTVEGEEISYGIASGLLDRFARLEAGILASYPCEIAVMTATSSANYTLNLQRSNIEQSTQQPSIAVPLNTSLVRTVIPGTSRGDSMDRIAFRLHRAANP